MPAFSSPGVHSACNRDECYGISFGVIYGRRVGGWKPNTQFPSEILWLVKGNLYLYQAQCAYTKPPFFMGFYCDFRNVIRKPSCIGTMETQGSFKPGFERYSQTKLYDKYGNLVTILHWKKENHGLSHTRQLACDTCYRTVTWNPVTMENLMWRHSKTNSVLSLQIHVRKDCKQVWLTTPRVL